MIWKDYLLIAIFVFGCYWIAISVVKRDRADARPLPRMTCTETIGAACKRCVDQDLICLVCGSSVSCIPNKTGLPI